MPRLLLKFIKDHPVGIKKGEVRPVHQGIGEKFIEEGYCEIIEQEEYDKIAQKMKEDAKPKKNQVKDLKPAPKKEKKYKALDELDLESLVIAKEKQSLKVGDEVLLNEKNEIKVNKDGLVTLKNKKKVD